MSRLSIIISVRIDTSTRDRPSRSISGRCVSPNDSVPADLVVGLVEGAAGHKDANHGRSADRTSALHLSARPTHDQPTTTTATAPITLCQRKATLGEAGGPGHRRHPGDQADERAVRRGARERHRQDEHAEDRPVEERPEAVDDLDQRAELRRPDGDGAGEQPQSPVASLRHAQVMRDRTRPAGRSAGRSRSRSRWRASSARRRW